MTKLGKKLIKAAKQGVAIAKRSAAAKDLESPKYRQRVVPKKRVIDTRWRMK